MQVDNMTCLWAPQPTQPVTAQSPEMGCSWDEDLLQLARTPHSALPS